MSSQQQQQVTNKPKPASTIKKMCVLIQPIHAIQVLIGLSILVFYAYTIGMLFTIDSTLNGNQGITDQEFKDKYDISRLQLQQLRDTFIFIIVALSSVITIWVWNYLIPLDRKVALIENKFVGIMVILFFFIVSLVSFFEISKKSFASEHIRTLNTATIFFSILILFLYAMVYFYNKYSSKIFG